MREAVMSTTLSIADRFVQAVRWTARLLALVVLGFLLMIFIGEPAAPLMRLNPRESAQMFLFLTAALGLALAWRWEVLGGALTLTGLALFYLNEYRLMGRFPGGWAFAVMAVPAALFLIAASTRRKASGAIGDARP
jgi:hypothetical protein